MRVLKIMNNIKQVIRKIIRQINRASNKGDLKLTLELIRNLFKSRIVSDIYEKLFAPILKTKCSLYIDVYLKHFKEFMVNHHYTSIRGMDNFINDAHNYSYPYAETLKEDDDFMKQCNKEGEKLGVKRCLNLECLYVAFANENIVIIPQIPL